MKKIYIFICIAVSVSAYSQRFDWVKFVAPVGNNTSSGAAHDLVRDEQGNLYTMSLFANPLALEDQVVTPAVANLNLLLIKWNDQGEVIAHKRLQCGGGGFTPHAMAYDPAHDQLLISTDISMGPIDIENGPTINGDNTVAHILRFDADLDYVSDQPHLHTYYVPMTVDGDYLYYSHGYQSTVYKRDSQNQQIWSLTPTNGAYSIYSITTAPDGAVYVAGRAGGVFSPLSVTLGGVTVTFPAGASDQVVVYKIDADGNVISGHHVGKTVPGNYRMPIQTDADGNLYLMTTYQGTEQQAGGIDLPNSSGGNDAYLIKFSPDMEALWVRPFQNSLGNMSTRGLYVDTDGSIVATGRFGGDSDFDGITFNSGPYGTGYLAKIDAADGSVIYATPVGPLNGTGDANGVVRIADSYYVGGGSFSFGEDTGSYGCHTLTLPGLFLTKVTDMAFSQPEIALVFEDGVLSGQASDEAVSYQWFLNDEPIADATQADYTPSQNGIYTLVATFEFGCSDTAAFEVTTLSVTGNTTDALAIFPNPSNGTFTIKSNLSGEKQVYIQDLNGRIVYKSSEQFTSEEKTISISGLSQGMYVLRIGQLTTKLIIR